MIEIVIELSPLLRATVSGDDVKMVIEQAAFFNELPSSCPKCDATVIFTYRHPTKGNKTYHYYGMRCLGDPAHETTFGQHMEGGSLFVKPNKWKMAYEARAEEEAEDEPQETERAPAPMRQPPSKSQQSGAVTALDIEKRARELVRLGRVSKDTDHYQVKAETEDNRIFVFRVSRNQANQTVCNCEEFQDGITENDKFKCVHILAVKQFTVAVNNTATTQRRA